MQQTVMSAEQIEAWRAAIRRTTFANYHYEMGVAILRNGEHAAAVGHLRQALDLQPDHWRAAHRLAEALQNCGETAEANRLFASAEHGLPGIADLLVGETLTERLERDAPKLLEPEVRALLAHQPGNVTLQLVLAVILLKQYQVQQAVAALNALEIPAACTLPAPLIGHVVKELHLLVWEGQFACVVKTLGQLRQIAPDDASLCSLLAYVHLLQRHPDQALDALSALPAPLDVLALARRSLAHLGLGMEMAVEAGIGELKRAGALPAFRTLLEALLNIQRGNPQAAMEYAAKGAEAPDSTPTNQLLYAVLLDQAGDRDRAQALARAVMGKVAHLIDFSVAELALPPVIEQATGLLSRLGRTVERL